MDQGIEDTTIVRPRSLTRHGDFNRLWVGQAISSFGTQISMLAIPLTAVLYLHAGVREVGLLSACENFAFIAPMLFIGVWVDRRSRRPLLIGADLARALVLLTVPVLAWLHQLSIDELYLTVILTGALSALFSVTYGAYLTSVVPADLLEPGNRRMQATESLSQILGPSLGGFLVAVLRGPFAVLIDAVSFVFSAGAVGSVRAKEPPVKPGGSGRGVIATFRDIGAGVKATVADPALRTLAGAASVFNFCAGIVLTIFVLYAVRERGMSATEIGLVNASFGAGGVLGAALLERALRRYGYGPFLLRGYVVAILAVASIPCVGGHGAAATALFASAYFVAGITIIPLNIAETTLRQLIVPRELQGRVRASFDFAIGAFVPVAALVAGALGAAIGLRATLLVAAAIIPVSLLWFIRSPLLSLQIPKPAVGSP